MKNFEVGMLVCLVKDIQIEYLSATTNIPKGRVGIVNEVRQSPVGSLVVSVAFSEEAIDRKPYFSAVDKKEVQLDAYSVLFFSDSFQTLDMDICNLKSI